MASPGHFQPSNQPLCLYCSLIASWRWEPSRLYYWFVCSPFWALTALLWLLSSQRSCLPSPAILDPVLSCSFPTLGVARILNCLVKRSQVTTLWPHLKVLIYSFGTVLFNSELRRLRFLKSKTCLNCKLVHTAIENIDQILIKKTKMTCQLIFHLQALLTFCIFFSLCHFLQK